MEEKIQICMYSPRQIIVIRNNIYMDKKLTKDHDKVKYELFSVTSSGLRSLARKSMISSLDDDIEMPMTQGEAF